MDTTLFLWLNGFVGGIPPFDAAIELIASDYLAPAALALALLLLWFSGDASSRQRRQFGVVAALFAIAISNGSIEILNNFLFRDRPFVVHEVTLLFYEPTDSSFPANSAALAFSIGASVWAFHRAAGWALLGVGALYAFSRVYAGVHYPLDVLAGAGIGVAAAVLGRLIAHALRPLIEIVLKAARVAVLA